MMQTSDASAVYVQSSGAPVVSAQTAATFGAAPSHTASCPSSANSFPLVTSAGVPSMQLMAHVHRGF